MKTGPKQKHNNHKNWKTGWRYKKDAPYDLKWQEDRSKLFKESGNGWWNPIRKFKYKGERLGKNR